MSDILDRLKASVVRSHLDGQEFFLRALVEDAGDAVDEIERLRADQNQYKFLIETLYEMAPDMERDGVYSFSGHFASWNEVVAAIARAWPQEQVSWGRSPIELVDRLIDERNELRAAIAAEREQCCKDVCPWCADGDEPHTLGPHNGVWYHDMPDGAEHEVCRAWLIRERAAKQEGGG